MEKYESFEKILTNLNILRYIIISKVKVGDYSTNKKVEGFYGDLLNKVYGWDLKRSDKITNPGIDLACETTLIGVQVTSQKKHDKVTKTLELFDKYYLGTLNRVIIFNITSKSNHSKDFTSLVTFDKEKDIIDLDDILIEIEKLETPKLKEIEKYILQEIPYYISKITNEKDFLRNRVDYKNVVPKNCLKFLSISSDPNELANFKKKVNSLHSNLLSISKKERQAFLAFLTKCDKSEFMLAASTWCNVLMDSFYFEKNELPGLIELLLNKNLLYNDEDEFAPLVHACDKDLMGDIVSIITDEDNFHDFICNLNFSILDV